MPTMADLVGTLAALLTTLSFAPQVLKTLRTGDTSGISLWMYLLFCLGVALWGLYGLMIGSWPVIIANLVTLGLASIVLWHKLRSLAGGRPEP